MLLQAQQQSRLLTGMQLLHLWRVSPQQQAVINDNPLRRTHLSVCQSTCGIHWSLSAWRMVIGCLTPTSPACNVHGPKLGACQQVSHSWQRFMHILLTAPLSRHRDRDRERDRERERQHVDKARDKDRHRHRDEKSSRDDKGSRLPPPPPRDAPRGSRGSKDGEGVSVGATNDMRAKLGLKPLK